MIPPSLTSSLPITIESGRERVCTLDTSLHNNSISGAFHAWLDEKESELNERVCVVREEEGMGDASM